MTNDQLNNSLSALTKAITYFESKADLARKLDITPPNLQSWLGGLRDIPCYRALQIESLTRGNVAACELRPDMPLLKIVKVSKKPLTS